MPTFRGQGAQCRAQAKVTEYKVEGSASPSKECRFELRVGMVVYGYNTGSCDHIWVLLECRFEFRVGSRLGSGSGLRLGLGLGLGLVVGLGLGLVVDIGLGLVVDIETCVGARVGVGVSFTIAVMLRLVYNTTVDPNPNINASQVRVR